MQADTHTLFEYPVKEPSEASKETVLLNTSNKIIIRQCRLLLFSMNHRLAWFIDKFERAKLAPPVRRLVRPLLLGNESGDQIFLPRICFRLATVYGAR